MRVKLRNFSTPKELYAYLVKNKAELIATKKSMPIKSDVFACDMADADDKLDNAIKSNTPINEDRDRLNVKVIANMTLFCDSHYDVLAEDCFTKSVQENGPEGKNTIHHLHDHEYSLEGKIGKPRRIYGEVMRLSKLGFRSAIKTAQALIFESEIIKSWNQKVFEQYKDAAINQHSIGMQYVQLELAINDEEYKDEYACWQKYIGKIINREMCEKSGYFWYVPEIKLYENSAVLFGANSLTPTLDNDLKSITPIEEPAPATPVEEPKKEKKVLDLKKVNELFTLKK